MSGITHKTGGTDMTKAQTDVGSEKEKKADKHTKKKNAVIQTMMVEGIRLDKEARHRECGHIIAHADVFYGRTAQVPKIKKEEFFQSVDLKAFKYGLPAIVIDFVDTVTGSNFISEL